MTLLGREVTVLGAGIGGLAVATALARRGARVTVLEQAEALREVGAGLQVSPNGAVVLRAIGLGAALAEVGTQAAAVELRDGRDGALVTRLDLGQDMGRSAERAYRFVHRADLIAMLADAARGAGVELHLLQRVTEVSLATGAPMLRTAAGAEVQPDLLIGADGLHSLVRAALNGPAAPFFTGQIAWRALIPCTSDAAPVAEVHMGAGRHLVSYPLRGGTLRNIVAVEERRAWVEESWSLRDDPMEMRLAFDGFSPRVQEWLATARDVGLWGLFRHPVAPVWGWAKGAQGVAILGDAAHPTLPFLAQGANMALEDAWVLAAALVQHDSITAALAAYQAARAPRTARIVEAASRNARAYHLRSPAREVAHLGLRAIGRVAPGMLTRRFDWLYGHDVTRGAG